MTAASTTHPHQGAALAFFDVDETLISLKSMFDFYDYFLCSRGRNEAERVSDLARFRAELGMLSREQANRKFYSCFAGVHAAELAQLGFEWFDARMQSGRLFHQDVLTALHGHVGSGTRAVLVSGSFSGCLDPIAEYTGADIVRCTEIEIVDGVYSGRVLEAMIGSRKAGAVTELTTDLDVDPAHCWAYGDHPSDLAMLEMVGHPVAVGNHVEVVAHAQQKKWTQLAGTTDLIGAERS